MRQVTIYTTNKEYEQFVQMAKSLSYVKKIETDEEPTKKQILDGIEQAIKEVKLVKAGKLKARPLQELLDELRA